MNERPLALAIAAVLLALLSLPNLASPLVPSEGVPPFVIYLSVVLGVLGLSAARGLWRLKRWGLWLTLIVCLLGILSAAPGIPFGPTAFLQAAALFGVIGSALIMLLVVLPDSRRACT